ncbi:MAG TPA: hypothetical protein VFJ16_23450 [Longimicrobium sp.]|nr:hypothetical protein [Longimicrobium sp.]
MNRWRGAALCAAAWAGWSCAGVPSPVPVQADPAAAAWLAGEWVGEYESPALGRGGSIVFNLAAGRDTADGDVVMVPRGALAPLRPAVAARPGALVRAAEPRVLTIRFVRVRGDTVSGALDPFLDPDCGCTRVSRFTGTLSGGRLRGTFVTYGAPEVPVAAGTWSAERRRP